MANISITSLPAALPIDGTELVPIVQTGTTKRITAQDIANLGNASGVEGSGTINKLAKFTASSTIGNSQLFDDGTSVGLGTITPLGLLHLFKASATTRMVMDGNASQSKIITYRTNGLQRFGLYLNNTPESGSNVGSDFQIRAYNDAGTLLTTPLFIKRSTGNVGIGTTSPAVKLESKISTSGLPVTSGTTQTNGALRISSSATTGILDFGINGANNWIQSTDAGDLSQGYNLLLNPRGGNVLIGTTTDAGYKLDVNGTARATDFYTSGWFRNSAGNKGLYNSAYNTHLYSRAAGIWSIASSNSTLGYLELWYGYYDEGGAAIKGSLAWNSAGFGLLNDQQSEYSVLCYQGASYGGTLRGGWNIDGANLSINPNATFEYAQITYSSSLDPNSYNWYSGMEYDPTADETYYYIRYIDGNQFRVYPDGTIYINGGVFSQYTATSNYISVGAYGLYSSTYSAYFRRNDASSYAAWELVGAKGGYTGMYYSASNQPHIMFNTSNGNGGLYYQTNSRWILYYDYGNNCLAVGGTTTNATYKMYVTGAIYATGAIVANSDGRNKENVEVVENALEKVNNLRGVTYTKKDQDSGKREMGVIAQEVLPHVPEVVQYAEDLDQYGVSYGNFAGLFIEAIKEQQVLINELKAKIEILENK